MSEHAVLEEMLEAGLVALSECRLGDCTDEETVCAIYAAMQTMKELVEAREQGRLIN